MYQIKSDRDKNWALDILEKAFSTIAGVMWVIKNKKNREEHVRMLLSFCFQETSKKQGAYLTSDRNGVVFFYNLQNRPKSIFSFFGKLYLIIRVVGIKRSVRVIRARKLIDSIRPNQGWYGWFLATEKGVVGTNAGYEIKRDMFRMADAKNEPIYIETTIRRCVTLYSRIGFYEYVQIKHPYEDFDIWFMKRDLHTFNR